MATTMRNFMKLNVGLASNILLKNNFQNSYRFLYSESSLGLVAYKNARVHFRNQFLNVEDTFRIKMKDVCETESGMIFTEDLKAILHLVQRNSEDVELLFKMITKFNNQSKELRFGSFVFGPVVMRTLYYLDEPELALTAFKDPAFENFFDQFTSYQILLSLLYKYEKYADMREVYDMIKTKTTPDTTYSISSLILVMAACYKQNTPETFKYALNLWKELNSKEIPIIRKASIFLAALAINQNASHLAIEILSSIKEARHIGTRCLKVVAYTNLKKFTEIAPFFKLSLDNNRPTAPKEVYFKDVIDNLEVAMANEEIPDDFELYKLLALLKKNDHITVQTLEDHLCKEITFTSFDRKKMRPSKYNIRQQPKHDKMFMHNDSYRSGLRDIL